MRFVCKYDRFSIVLVLMLTLLLSGGATAFGGQANGALGGEVIYITNGGLGEGYVPRPHKKSPPRHAAYTDDSFLNEGYVVDKTKSDQSALVSTRGDGSEVIYTTNGGLGEGYVPRPHKKSPPRHVVSFEENTKPVEPMVIYNTGEGPVPATSVGTIAPGWQPSNDHSLDFVKDFFRKILPAEKKGEASARAAHVDDAVFEDGYSAGERAPSTVVISTGDRGLTEASTAPKISGGMAAGSSDKPLSERRAERSYQTTSLGFAVGSEDEEVDTSETVLVAIGADEYLDDYEDDEFADISEDEVVSVADPIEGFNRAMFTVNDRLYFWIFRPVARGYSRVVPEPGRVAVRRFFDNFYMPVRFANNILQLKFKYAGIELERFVINSTVGVLGFMDPAKSRWNIEGHDEDFGQTLGFYGLGPGMYLNLPVFGPSNVRDTVGMVADIFLSPMAYILPHDREIVVGIDVFHRLNEVSLNIGLYEDIKRDALDPYIFIRNAYHQHRISVIKE